MKTRDTLLQRTQDTFYNKDGSINAEVMHDICAFFDRGTLSPFKLRGPDGAMSVIDPRTNYTMRVINTRETPLVIITSGNLRVYGTTDIQAFYMLGIAQRTQHPPARKLKFDMAEIDTVIKHSHRVGYFEGNDDTRGASKYDVSMIDHLGMVFMTNSAFRNAEMKVTIWVKKQPTMPAKSFDSLIKVGDKGVWLGYGSWIERTKAIMAELRAETEAMHLKQRIEQDRRKEAAEKKLLTDLSQAETLLWSGSENDPPVPEPTELITRRNLKQQFSAKYSKQRVAR